MNRDKTHARSLKRIDNAVGNPGAKVTGPDGSLLVEVEKVIENEGYEVTDMGHGTMYIHGNGRDDSTVWTEVIDGKLMLAVGDHLGMDVRYIPAIVGYCLCKTDVPLPAEE